MLDDRCRFRGTERRTIHTQLPLYFAHLSEQNRPLRLRGRMANRGRAVRNVADKGN